MNIRVNKRRLHAILHISLLSSFLYFIGCAAIQEFANVQKPTAKVDKVSFTGMSFDAISLAFDVKVQNPNPIAATLAGFDYDLLIENQSFLTGNQNEQMTINSMGESTVRIPVSIPFRKLFDTYKAISKQDSVDFQLKSGISVNIPVLGATKIPLSHSGKLPVLKVPKVDFAGVRLKKLSLSKADLEIKMSVDNPNGFNLNSKAYKFKFFVNDQQWADGIASNPIQVLQKTKKEIAIPISLNLYEMGRTVYNLVSGNRSMKYRLVGDMDLDTSMPMIGDVNIPFDRTGNFTIRR
jgi:LEA14-like dessication related protein